MKSYHYARTTVRMSQSDVLELCKILNASDAPDLTRFFNINHPEEQTFYQLVAQVLTLNGISTVIAPNKWEPANLFYQLKRVVEGHNIELLDELENNDFEAHDIKFSVDGVQQSLTVDTTDPSQLFNVINEQLIKYQFVRLVSHLKERRSVEWMLAPMPFDVAKFKQLTGCSEMKSEWKQQSLGARYSDRRTPNVSQVDKLSKKVFFKPSAFCLNNGTVEHLSYTDPQTGQPKSWAGRIMPGHTFTEGIASELREVLNYEGKFEFYNFMFLDYAFDNEGKEIERYRLTLKLFEPVTVKKTSTGLVVHLSPNH